jgi:hypothetical protein
VVLQGATVKIAEAEPVELPKPTPFPEKTKTPEPVAETEPLRRETARPNEDADFPL